MLDVSQPMKFSSELPYGLLKFRQSISLISIAPRKLRKLTVASITCLWPLIMLSLLTASMNLFSEERTKTQTGIGTVSRAIIHEVERYVFISGDKEKIIRDVKFVPGHLGYARNKLPLEIEELLAKAMKEKLNVELACEIHDHGTKAAAICLKITSLKIIESEKDGGENINKPEVESK